MTTTRLKQFAVTLALLGMCTAACAQYIWLDDNGRKQFSDMPPPASVPQKRILKEPVPVEPEAAPADGTDKTEPAAEPNKPAPPMTIAEKNAEYQKRQIEQAEKEAKAAEKARNEANKAKNCQRAREYQQALESGQRIGHTDENGERIIMSDGDRAREANEAKRYLDACK